MLTYQEALAEAGGNLSLDEYKRLYQEQCRQAVKAGIVSADLMALFSREITKKVKVEYRDVDYD